MNAMGLLPLRWGLAASAGWAKKPTTAIAATASTPNRFIAHPLARTGFSGLPLPMGPCSTTSLGLAWASQATGARRGSERSPVSVGHPLVGSARTHKPRRIIREPSPFRRTRHPLLLRPYRNDPAIIVTTLQSTPHFLRRAQTQPSPPRHGGPLAGTSDRSRAPSGAHPPSRDLPRRTEAAMSEAAADQACSIPRVPRVARRSRPYESVRRLASTSVNVRRPPGTGRARFGTQRSGVQISPSRLVREGLLAESSPSFSAPLPEARRPAPSHVYARCRPDEPRAHGRRGGLLNSVTTWA